MGQPTILKLGRWTTSTDVFSAHPASPTGAIIDLNDSVVFNILDTSSEGKGMGLEWDAPRPTVYDVGNPRSIGRSVVRRQYDTNRASFRVSLVWLGVGSSYSTWVTNLHNLVQTLEGITPQQPAALQFQPSGGSTLQYFDVLEGHLAQRYAELLYLQQIDDEVVIEFTCKPFLRGARCVLANGISNPGFEVPGNLGVQVFADTFANSNAYTTYTGAAPTVASNVMTIALNAGVTFGSPVWSAINNWQLRFKAATGMNVFFMLHRVDANNQLRLNIALTQIQLQHIVAGTANILATATPTLTNGTFYWLQMTQFPATPGFAPILQATLYNDSAGVVGSAVASGAVGPVAAHDSVTALIGQPAIEADGAALSIGGNFSGVHLVQLFGPGGWAFTSQNGSPTGVCSGAWDGTRLDFGMSGNATLGAQTYGGAPVTSVGAARVTLPPAGSVNALWATYNGGPPAGTSAIPISAPGNVVKFSAWTITSGLAASGSVQLYLQEWNASGANLRATQAAVLTGNQASWTQMSGSVTTGASTAYVSLQLLVVDGTANSANATVWFDNVQCWDSTRTGMTSMPYCEMSFPQTPAQLMVSGVLGDVKAPAIHAIGVYLGSWSPGQTGTIYCGRRALVTPSMLMVGVTPPGATPALDSTKYGGFTTAQNPGPLAYSAVVEQGVYHLLTLVKTGNASPTVVLIQPDIVELSNGVDVGRSQGTGVFPFTAQNTWTLADTGQVNLPPYPLSSLADNTKISGTASTTSSGSGGSQLTANWVALLPVDAETGVFILGSNANNTAITAQWFYVYWDGLALSAPHSVETASLPNPSHAASFPVNASWAFQKEYGVSNLGDASPLLDPALTTTVGGTLWRGVNQFTVIAADNAAAIWPATVEITYSPLYLYPL